jgi:large subunit ribosomal protein L28
VPPPEAMPGTLTAYQENRSVMAKRCELCGKGPVVGRNISHAHNVTPRRFEPNLQRVRALVNGGIKRLRVCTRCLRSNKVVKAA